jgi:hypothetical protein
LCIKGKYRGQDGTVLIKDYFADNSSTDGAKICVDIDAENNRYRLKSLYQLGFVCFFDFYFWIGEMIKENFTIVIPAYNEEATIRGVGWFYFWIWAFNFSVGVIKIHYNFRGNTSYFYHM